MLTLATILEYLEAVAPLETAADWDNCGLLLGDRNARIERVMTCLTVTQASAAEAVAEHAELVVSHHPVLFRGVKRLTTDTADGRMLLELLRAGIAVYSPHTAFDNAKSGINEILCERLGLLEVNALRSSEAGGQCKVVVFVPDGDLSRVSDAMFAAGAGRIGQYSQCSFRHSGTGTFFGSDASNPTVGKKGQREEVAEWRLEVVCPGQQVNAVITAMRRAHSYEEPAYDVYPLRPRPSPTGAGRLGRLAQPALLVELAQRVKTQLRCAQVQVVGSLGQTIQRVAVVCGSGSDFLTDAIKAGVEVLITGELRLHDYLAAQAHGLALVLPGHFASERIGVESLAERIRQEWPQLHVWASRREQDPVLWI